MKVSIKTLGFTAVALIVAVAIGNKWVMAGNQDAEKAPAKRKNNPCEYTADFKDNGNGTLTDPSTGLVWQTCALGQTWHGGCSGNATLMNQAEAMKAAENSSYQNASGWRLPTKNELAGIMVTAECKDAKKWIDPRLATPIDGKDDLGSYWTSTEYGTDGYLVWYANLNTGYMGGINNVNFNAVRLVRSGS